MNARARALGARDGQLRAWSNRFDCDPTGGFIRRLELDECDRTAYVDAYLVAFSAALPAKAVIW